MQINYWESPIQINREVFCNITGGMILLHTSLYNGLDPIGINIGDLLHELTSIGEIIHTPFLCEYDMEPKIVLQTLLAAKLVDIDA